LKVGMIPVCRPIARHHHTARHARRSWLESRTPDGPSPTDYRTSTNCQAPHTIYISTSVHHACCNTTSHTSGASYTVSEWTAIEIGEWGKQVVQSNCVVLLSFARFCTS